MSSYQMPNHEKLTLQLQQLRFSDAETIVGNARPLDHPFDLFEKNCRTYLSGPAQPYGQTLEFSFEKRRYKNSWDLRSIGLRASFPTERIPPSRMDFRRTWDARKDQLPTSNAIDQELILADKILSRKELALTDLNPGYGKPDAISELGTFYRKLVARQFTLLGFEGIERILQTATYEDGNLYLHQRLPIELAEWHGKNAVDFFFAVAGPMKTLWPHILYINASLARNCMGYDLYKINTEHQFWAFDHRLPFRNQIVDRVMQSASVLLGTTEEAIIRRQNELTKVRSPARQR